MGFLTLLTLWARRNLARNSINFSNAMLPVLGALGVLIHRVLGTLRHAPLTDILADDHLVLCALSIGAGLFVQRGYFVSAALFFVGAVFATAAPLWAQTCYSVFAPAGLVAAFVYWVATAPRASGQDPV